jgi:hypothetical protein
MVDKVFNLNTKMSTNKVNKTLKNCQNESLLLLYTSLMNFYGTKYLIELYHISFSKF